MSSSNRHEGSGPIEQTGGHLADDRDPDVADDRDPVQEGQIQETEIHQETAGKAAEVMDGTAEKAHAAIDWLHDKVGKIVAR